MFYIVESEESLSKLELLVDQKWFIEVVTSNDNFHPQISKLVAVYVRPILEDQREKGYIIPIDHPDGLGVSKERVWNILKKVKKIYIPDKKAGLYFFNFGKETYDIQILYSMTFYRKANIVVKEKTYNWFYNRYADIANINETIPLPKIYEKCEGDYEQFKKLKIFSLRKPVGFQFYNEIATKVYFMVEQEGIRVDIRGFLDKYNPDNPRAMMDREIVYNRYNLSNSTSRPTNSFGSVNFLAIPKGEEFRRVFKPKNDTFVEMDFDGYHIRLISKLIGHKLESGEKAHKQIARMYLGDRVEDMTPEEYAKAKASNFKMIYGTVQKDLEHLEISKEIQKYIADLWTEFESEKAISNPESQKQFTSNLKDMYPNKLFNYLVQSLETSRNIRVLYRILKQVQQFKSKIILVTYDSFLIDWDESEPEILEIVKRCMEGKTKDFPIGIKYSKDLNFK